MPTRRHPAEETALSATPAMTTPTPTIPRERVTRARTAVFVIFALAGLVFASWASRIADAKDALGPHRRAARAHPVRRERRLGHRPAAGRADHRPDRRDPGGRARHGVGLVGLLAVGVVVDAHGPRWGVAAGLFLVGLGIGHLGRLDEPRGRRRRAPPRHLGDAALPRRLQRRHGRVGAGRRGDVAGRRAAHRALRRRRRRHRGARLVGAAALPAALDRAATRRPRAARERHRSAWLEPRTLLIGLVVFAAAFTEGTANDWLAVAFVEGHELPDVGRGARLRDLPHLHDPRPDRRHRPARPLRPGAGAAGELRARRASVPVWSSSGNPWVAFVGHRRLGRRRRARLPGRAERVGRRRRAGRGPDVGRRHDRLRRLHRRPAACSACSATGSGCCTRCSSWARSPSSRWRSSPPCASPTEAPEPARRERRPHPRR